METQTAEDQRPTLRLTEPNADIQAQMDTLWTENRAMLLERVEMLERECSRWLSASNGRTAGVIARNLARRLASILGTFGMERGSTVAASIERMLDTPKQVDRHGAETIYALLSELREMIRARN